MENMERFTPLYAILNDTENLRFDEEGCFHVLVFYGLFYKRNTCESLGKLEIVWKHSPYGFMFPLSFSFSFSQTSTRFLFLKHVTVQNRKKIAAIIVEPSSTFYNIRSNLSHNGFDHCASYYTCSTIASATCLANVYV